MTYMAIFHIGAIFIPKLDGGFTGLLISSGDKKAINQYHQICSVLVRLLWLM